jgi:hypothetical protein
MARFLTIILIFLVLLVVFVTVFGVLTVRCEAGVTTGLLCTVTEFVAPW